MDISHFLSQIQPKQPFRVQVIALGKETIQVQWGSTTFELPNQKGLQLGDFLLLNEQGKVLKNTKPSQALAQNNVSSTPSASFFPSLKSLPLHSLPQDISLAVQNQWKSGKIEIPFLQSLAERNLPQIADALAQQIPLPKEFQEHHWQALAFRQTPLSNIDHSKVWEQTFSQPQKALPALLQLPQIENQPQYINLSITSEKVLPKLSFTPIYSTSLPPEQKENLQQLLASLTDTKEAPLSSSKKNVSLPEHNSKPQQSKTLPQAIQISLPWPHAITPQSQKIANLEQIPTPYIHQQFQALHTADLTITPSLLQEWVQQSKGQTFSAKEYLPFLLLGRHSETPPQELFQMAQHAKQSPNLQDFIQDSLEKTFKLYTPQELQDSLTEKSSLKKMIFLNQWENQWQEEPSTQLYFSDGRQTQEIKVNVRDQRQKNKNTEDQNIHLNIQTQTTHLGPLDIRAQLTPKQELHITILGKYPKHAPLFEAEKQNFAQELLPLLLQSLQYQQPSKTSITNTPLTTGSFDIRI